MLRHMHRQVGTSQGSDEPPPNDTQVGERGEAAAGEDGGFSPQNLTERLGAASGGVPSPG